MERDTLLKEALKKVPNKCLLINMVARRVRQLNAGARPLIKVEVAAPPDLIALQEIAEGRLESRYVKEGDNVAKEILG